MIDQIMYIQGVLDQNLQFQRTITKQKTLHLDQTQSWQSKNVFVNFLLYCTCQLPESMISYNQINIL